ncbi:pathogen-associated molecular patterns-induced protein A70 [Cannabis sativa]|nr:pathogen-associated molecular patterns-induced protein A70 [Cannabis sativa]
MWTFTASWLTPSSLFLFLNLMIGTLFLMSRFGTRKTPTHDQLRPHGSPQLVRSGSLLERVKSFNLSLYKFESSPAVETVYHHHPTDPDNYPTHPTQLGRSPSFLERLRSVDLSYVYKFDHQQTHPEPEPETVRHEEKTPVQNHMEQDHYPVRFQNPIQPPQLVRTPSFLERLRSIDLSYAYRFDHQQTNPAPESKTARDPNPLEDHSHEPAHVTRSKSESESHGAHAEKKSQTEMMTKSASEKMGQGVRNSSNKDKKDNDEEEEEEVVEAVERRRPATTRVERRSCNNGGETTSVNEFDDGVDAKADDFINRFKQQLKLQRLESFKRFSEMLSGK